MSRRNLCSIAMWLSSVAWASPAKAQEAVPPKVAESPPCEAACRVREVECRASCEEPTPADPEARRGGEKSPCQAACDVDSIDCYDQCVPPPRE